MPAPAFEWKSYEVPRAGAARRTVAPAEAVEEETVTVHLPVLTAFPTPLEKARILLESAAEIEHQLLVQYLYAAFSLKSPDAFADHPARENAVRKWNGDLHHIARQEMGHLMTVENLLLSLGLKPNLEREDFPPRKDLYPFPLHLEPLSQRSVAKYVAAESPTDAIDIDDILELATQSAGAMVNHVGVLYGLLGVVFSTKAQVDAGGSGSEAWDEQLRELAAAAKQQQPAPEAWHLPDGAIDPQTLDRQGSDSWERGNTVFQITDRASALTAIRDVAEEGEGAIDRPDSHYAVFRAMFEGVDDEQTGEHTLPFPAAGEWVPAHAVPVDPRPAEIAEARTRRWAQLADIRYGILLGSIEQHLRTTDEEDRDTLRGWAIQDMFQLASLARTLTTLPQAPGVAAIPFTMPTPLPLPDEEAARWGVLLALMTASIEKIEEMQRLHEDDGANGDLTSLLEATRERRTLITAGKTPPPPDPTTSFARDILPLFRPIDIEHMNDMMGMDLSDYEVVRTSAPSISRRVQGLGGRIMPPPPDAPWTPDKVALFDKWVAEGFPE
jgi:hypothetical protein